MQLRYVFTELRQGLRRNLSMQVAVIVTLFVSLTLVGLGALLNQQAQKAAQHWGDQLQITVWLCKAEDDNPACKKDVTDAQRAAVLDVVDAHPEVAGWHTESQEEAFAKVKELLGPEKFEGPHPAATAEAMPESIWIELKDPEDYDGVSEAVTGMPGVSGIRDMRDVLEPIYGSLDALTWGALGAAAVLLLAALLLVGNTIRLAAFARRREIGIMRLVGASSLYITLPFLMEALVTALVGIGLAAAALGAFMWFGIHERAGDQLKFMPWIGTSEYLWSLVVIAVLGPVLTLLPTLLMTRKYVKV